MAYSGERKLAYDHGFNAALYGRDKANPYDISKVRASHLAYEEGYSLGSISDQPPRGPKGDKGDAGAAGPTGTAGNDGVNGSNGSSVHSTNGAPASGLGSDNDVAINADNGDIYLKVSGSWSLQGSPGSMSLTTRSDTIDPDVFPEVTYRGDALPGTATTAASWRVQRLTLQSDGDMAIEFADGNDNFDNIWDNRLSLIYS